MPRPKLKHDFTKEDPWRIFRIMSEFVEGFEELSDINKAVSIFGSSRVKPRSQYYKLAQKTAKVFSKAGYAIITGAGPGIMEAANKGAKEARGESIGLNILAPIQQKPNRHLTRLIEFRYFFCRRVMFAKYSQAFLIFPGGYGTMDEFMEAITLIQTNRLAARPVILFDKKYWRGLLDWIKHTMVAKNMIDTSDLDIFKLVETPQEALAIVNGNGRR
ncbi:MAG: TIGR00730 family Rossman fold protein [Candidatus Omnitrophica bacterium]|nr:TIGR00730 family Rossman fold protein [Candidatus Omnitrophota bacterium]